MSRANFLEFGISAGNGRGLDKMFIADVPSRATSTVADLFDEPFVRVDPWLGLGFNLAMNKKIVLVLIVLFGTGRNSFAQTNYSWRADRGYRRCHEEIPRHA